MRVATHRDILGNPNFRRLNLNPSGIALRQKNESKIRVQPQSLRLGTVEKALERRVHIEKIELHRTTIGSVYQVNHAGGYISI